MLPEFVDVISEEADPQVRRYLLGSIEKDSKNYREVLDAHLRSHLDAAVDAAHRGDMYQLRASARELAERLPPSPARPDRHGRLAPEAIQAIVRAHFGRFRTCYENGLRRNDRLEGRVAIKFVIGLDGSVSSVVDGGSDIPDAETRMCMATGFAQLRFPHPYGGIVTVVYPMIFHPGH